MKDKPLISVCVACYNVSAYIERCLDSICRQNYPNMEVICVDDGSSDNTAELIAGRAGEDSRICLICNEKNQKLIYSRKKAVSRARGEYVFLMDADDTLEKNALSRAVSLLRENQWPDVLEFKANVIFSDETNHEEKLRTGLKRVKDRLTGGGYCRIYPGRLQGDEILQKLVEDQVGQMPWNKLIRRDLLEQAYGFCDREDIYYKDDVYMCCFLYTLAKSYVGCNAYLYNYYFNTGKSKNMKQDKDFAEMCKVGDIVRSLLLFYQNQRRDELFYSLIKTKLTNWLALLENTLRENPVLNREEGYRNICRHFQYQDLEGVPEEITELIAKRLTEMKVLL